MFVYVVDLHEFVKRNLTVGMANTIMITNLLERLGSGWHLTTPLRRVRGLTFIE